MNFMDKIKNTKLKDKVLMPYIPFDYFINEHKVTVYKSVYGKTLLIFSDGFPEELMDMIGTMFGLEETEYDNVIKTSRYIRKLTDDLRQSFPELGFNDKHYNQIPNYEIVQDDFENVYLRFSTLSDEVIGIVSGVLGTKPEDKEFLIPTGTKLNLLNDLLIELQEHGMIFIASDLKLLFILLVSINVRFDRSDYNQEIESDYFRTSKDGFVRVIDLNVDKMRESRLIKYLYMMFTDGFKYENKSLVIKRKPIIERLKVTNIVNSQLQTYKGTVTFLAGKDVILEVKNIPIKDTGDVLVANINKSVRKNLTRLIDKHNKNFYKKKKKRIYNG